MKWRVERRDEYPMHHGMNFPPRHSVRVLCDAVTKSSEIQTRAGLAEMFPHIVETAPGQAIMFALKTSHDRITIEPWAPFDDCAGWVWLITDGDVR